MTSCPVEIRVKRLHERALLPCYMSEQAAGMDLHACLDASVELAPGERQLIPTGLAMAIPPGFEGQVRPRSGLALRHGLGMVNAPGTIDADYRGEIGVILVNHGQHPFVVQHGDRIAQLVIAPVVRAGLIEAADLDGAVRGSGGFGHTGMPGGGKG